MGHFQDSNIRGVSLSKVNEQTLKKIWGNSPDRILERKVMASPPTITESSAATLARLWPSNSFVTGAYGLSGVPFNYVKAGNIGALAAVSSYVSAQNIKKDASTYGRSNIGIMVWHTGRYIEFRLNGLSSSYMIKVNDEYVSLTPSVVANAISYIKIDFAAYKKRKVEVILRADAGFWGGLYTENTDTIEYITARGPKTVIVGDSFVGGFGTSSGMGALGSIPAYFADYMGWDDVLYDAIGGTGYLAKNGGANYNYRERVQHNVVNQNPEVVIITGGYNDRLETPESMYAEAALYFAEIRKGLPESLLIVFSPFWFRDITTYSSSGVNIIATRDAIKQAANEHGAIFIDILELSTPIDNILGRSGTLSSLTAAGATYFNSTTFFPVESAVQIGSDRCIIGSVSGSGPYTHNLKWGTLFNSHAVGTPVRSVGRGFWTGLGSVASPTGSGNCDVYVTGNTDIHPTDKGHEAIAALMVNKLLESLK